MKGTQNHLSHKCISPIDVGIRVEVIIKIDLETIMHIGDVQCIIKILEVGLEAIIAIEEIMDIMCKVIRGTETITMIIEGIIIEAKVMIERGVGH